MSTPVPIDQTSALRQAALRFLFERIDYERLMTMPYGDREFKLARMHELLERIGNPQRDMPIVHVAGTKGKGSVAAMIGAGGLGSKILYSIQRIDLGVGIESGLDILFIAVVLDRILQGITKKQQDAIMHNKS